MTNQQLIEAAKHAEQTRPVITRLEFDAQGVQVRQHLDHYTWTSIILWNEIERLIMMIDSGASMLIAKRLRDHTEWPVVPVAKLENGLYEISRDVRFRHLDRVFLMHPVAKIRLERGMLDKDLSFDPRLWRTLGGVPIREDHMLPDDVFLLIDDVDQTVLTGMRIQP